MTDNSVWDKTPPALSNRIRGWIAPTLSNNNDFQLPGKIRHRTAVAVYFEGSGNLRLQNVDGLQVTITAPGGTVIETSIKRLRATGTTVPLNQLLVGYV